MYHLFRECQRMESMPNLKVRNDLSISGHSRQEAYPHQCGILSAEGINDSFLVAVSPLRSKSSLTGGIQIVFFMYPGRVAFHFSTFQHLRILSIWKIRYRPFQMNLPVMLIHCTRSHCRCKLLTKAIPVFNKNSSTKIW